MRFQRTHIIALANQKGGCGKTTTAVSLAACLAHEGYLVCLVDTDPQCNATDTFGVNRDELSKAGRFTIADAYLTKKLASEIELGFGERFEERLTLVAGHRGLGTVPRHLETQVQSTLTNENYSELDADDLKNEHRQRLRNSLDSLRGHHDVVIIDTPPELGFLMTSSLIAADWFIVPVFPSGYDLKGLETLTRTVEKVQKRYNPRLRLLGVLLGNFDARTKLDADVQRMLVNSFSEQLVFQTSIHRAVKHREATVYGQTIIERAPGEQASDQFLSLAKEVIARLERSEERTETQPAELKEASRG
jgi:chromosome partitioning protein